MRPESDNSDVDEYADVGAPHGVALGEDLVDGLGNLALDGRNFLDLFNDGNFVPSGRQAIDWARMSKHASNQLVANVKWHNETIPALVDLYLESRAANESGRRNILAPPSPRCTIHLGWDLAVTCIYQKSMFFSQLIFLFT